MQKILILYLMLLFTQFASASPFASVVVRYEPAPGQFVNNEQFNDPNRALGAPVGGGTNIADQSSIVSLGAFGGSIVLGFDQTVTDDLLNPFGMDAIVFSNAFWSGSNPNDHWAECATIEISYDANQNGQSDDTWYLIPGSHISNPQNQWASATWDTFISDGTYPPMNETWLPPGSFGTWSTYAYELPAKLFSLLIVRNPSENSEIEGIFGYAEYSPTLLLGDLDANNNVDDPTMTDEDFYTVPDDPHTIGISPGSGGGDAFDIAWAIDPVTGEAANLEGFDFIRLTTAVFVDLNLVGPVGEKSAEIDAVADVAPDPFGDVDNDSDIDLLDMAEMQICFGVVDPGKTDCQRFDRNGDNMIALDDANAAIQRLTGPR